MAKFKKPKGNNFKRFEGRKANDRHVRITEDMMLSEAWTDLKAVSIRLYLAMKLRYKGNGQLEDIEYPHSEAEKIGISRNVIRASFLDLKEHGFIDITFEGRFRREANRYCFSDRWIEWKKVYNGSPKSASSTTPKSASIKCQNAS